jgi:hypothetical protein
LVALAGVFAAFWFVWMARPSAQNRAVSRESVARAHESFAIARLRGVRMAEEVYASSGSGRYGKLECLVYPRRCSDERADRGLLDSTHLTSDRLWGYRFEFFEGPPAAGGGTEPSPPDLTSYAYVALPVTPDATGARAFCVDSTRPVCAMPDGTMEPIVAAVCPETCVDLASKSELRTPGIEPAAAPSTEETPSTEEPPQGS